MRLTITLLTIAFSISFGFAQDPTNTCFQYGRMEYNPSYGGGDGPGKIGIRTTSRASFYPVRGPFNYSTISLDYSPCKTYLGLGLLVSQETQGDGYLKINKASFNIGITIPINKSNSFSIGIRPGVITQSVDWNEYTFTDQLDPIRGIKYVSNNQNANLDLSNTTNWDLGLRYNRYKTGRPYFMAGIAGFNVIEPNIGLLNRYQLQRRISFQTALIYQGKRNRNLIYAYYGRVEMQNKFTYAAINFELTVGAKISGGGGLKLPIFNPYGANNNLYPSIMFSYQINPILKIYSAVETNFLGVSIAGKTNSFEVGLVVVTAKKICDLKQIKDMFKYDYLDKSTPLNCPKFNRDKDKIETF
ncbi:MAG: type IX secretion system membrane protein PorP/SprF [Bacteroidia bacterium]|nr:type IX secretion system membrane protein PorP/SprF [Bacteroidia bacterium]MCF8425393.1 type IX secretion system membrane protein PorP/SprF [Bacteroidia bacterium]MCF8446434.1 type IX secretion system membrane protein PorP/SprF [Bacteroidia bacterium]